MSQRLDREGVFKAVPVAWGVQRNENSQSVALVVEYRITAQYGEGEWTSWEGYEEHTIYGYHYVIKRDGTLNQATFDQLVQCIGWQGSFRDTETAPPAVECQITVAREEYNGKSSLKVQWINPGDYVPGPKTVDERELANLDNRYGSLMRAAAAQAGKTAKPKAAPPQASEPPAHTDKDLPF